jgi:hypothetical protein
MAQQENSEKTLSESLEYINSFSNEKITEEELLSVISKIATIHRNKKFSYFSEEDIEGQVVLICLQQLKYYEPSKAAGDTSLNSIERWLNRVTKNRLANYYRDNYSSVNQGHRQTRINLNNCVDIDAVDPANNASKKQSPDSDPSYDVRFGEFKNFVESRLSEDLLDIYHACIEEENVSSYYKSKLNQEVSKIIEEWDELNKE